MKKLRYLLAFLLVSLTGCSTTRLKTSDSDSPQSPETVLITYHVKSGKEAEMEQVLNRAWKTYRQEHLVFAYPHLIVRDEEKDGKTRMVEVFTWVSHKAPDHAPPSVKAVWNDMMLLCESRDGHGPLEGGEVALVTWETR